MADGWLERGLAQQARWHVSDLSVESGPFGRLPVSIRVVAAPRDPVHLGEKARPEPQHLFAPRVIPLVLIFAIPAGTADALNRGAVERFQQRLRLPHVVVEVDGYASSAQSGITIVSSDGGLSGGDGASLASWVAEILTEREIPISHAAKSHKPLNTGRVNDLLHLWSREMLSSELIVNDIDAVSFTGVNKPLALVEIKRSGVVPWRPYRADASNYALLRALSMRAERDVFDITLHYDPNRQVAPYRVTPHFVVGTSTSSAPKTIGFAMGPLDGATPEATTTAVARFVESWTTGGYWADN